MEYAPRWPQTVRAVVDFGPNPNSNSTEHEIHFSDWTVCTLQTPEPTDEPTPAPTLALPPIDWCVVTISGAPWPTAMVFDVEWAEAQLIDGVTFGADQFAGDYKLYFTSKVRDGQTYADRIPSEFGYNASKSTDNVVRVAAILHALGVPNVDMDHLDTRFDAQMFDFATHCAAEHRTVARAE
jgi:hypothetical protein